MNSINGFCKSLKQRLNFTIKSVFVLFLICSTSISAQNGDFFISNYDKNAYSGHAQNFDIIQDNFGTLYFANNNWVLAYDSKTWQNIPLTGEKSAICFTKDKSGRIYIGGENEFGYLERDKRGKNRYVSLAHLIRKEDNIFTNIWYAFALKNDVYFCSNEILFKYSKGKITSWKPTESFHKAYILGNRFYIREVGKGIMYMDGDSLKYLKGSEIFAPVDYKIASIIETDRPGSYYVFTRKKGVFEMALDANGNYCKCRKLALPALDTITKNEPYDGIRAKQNIVIGTKKSGIFILDHHLNLVQNIHADNGLSSKNCNRLYIDNQGNLWCALDYGISKIEISSPIRKWDKANDILSPIESMVKYHDALVVGSLNDGLMSLDKATHKFKKILNLSSRCSDLKVYLNKLFIASDEGLYVIDGKDTSLIYDQSQVRSISFTPDSLIGIACEDRIVIIDPVTLKHKEEFMAPFNSPVQSFIYINPTTILASTRSEGMFVVDVTKNKTRTVPPSKYYVQTSSHNFFYYNRKSFVTTDSGVFLINEKAELEPFSEINTLIKGKYTVAQSQIHNNIFYASATTAKNKEEMFFVDMAKKPFKINNLLSRIGESNAKNIIEDNHLIYLPTNEGLYVYDPSQKNTQFKISASLFSIISKRDTLLENVIRATELPPLSYKMNELSFVAGSNDFTAENKLQFQFFLKGAEAEFNEWTNYHIRTYNNLSEGDYELYIRVKNIYGSISDTLVVKFNILPPWYRTKTAYFFYSILGILFLYGIIRFNSKRLIEMNRRLEKIIQERTEVVRNQKSEIEKQKHVLEEKQKEIVDSINYAKLIQTSVLADQDFLKSHLSQFFVFFKPKDIVSGDFYWATEQKGKFYLAACDSTGHGVPGAFMSLMNIGYLTEAINVKQIEEPNEVFDHVRSRLIQNLSKEGQKDGFDGILVCLDTQTRQMTYSAANNHPIVIRNGELMELNADRMPVGKGELNYGFSNHVVQLEKDDMLYLYTDGYADQFGGPKGKKFKYRQLNDTLLSICRNKMENQKIYLESTFENWKGELEQIDDVLIIGIRL